VDEKQGASHAPEGIEEPVEGTMAGEYSGTLDQSGVSMSFAFATASIVSTAADIRQFGTTRIVSTHIDTVQFRRCSQSCVVGQA
jgi:hypothetical protein